MVSFCIKSNKSIINLVSIAPLDLKANLAQSDVLDLKVIQERKDSQHMLDVTETPDHLENQARPVQLDHLAPSDCPERR